jgi:hypothetical protein
MLLLDGGAGADGEFGGKAVFFSDLVPTVAHVAFPWIMSYDLFPMTTLDNKKLWLPRAAAAGWLAVFQHETEAPLGRVVEDRPGRYRAVALLPGEGRPVSAGAPIEDAVARSGGT